MTAPREDGLGKPVARMVARLGTPPVPLRPELVLRIVRMFVRLEVGTANSKPIVTIIRDTV